MLAHGLPMPFEAADDRLIIGIAGPRSAVDDNIHGREQMLMMTKRFADEAFDLVPPYSVADDARRY